MVMATWFTQKQWVFDKAARRLSLKASAKVASARQHVFDTAIMDFIDMDLASFEALMILDCAMKEIQKTEDAAHKAAR